jgi:catalase
VEGVPLGHIHVPGGTTVTNPQLKPATTDAEIPVASTVHSLVIVPDGLIVLNDFYLIEQMANFNGNVSRTASTVSGSGR